MSNNLPVIPFPFPYSFSKQIKEFNQMYRMPVNEAPTLDIGMPVLQRLQDFKKILAEELNEIDEITAKLEAVAGSEMTAEQEKNFELEILTMLADLLGDIQVYCASEMTKFGLPVDHVLNIIMSSNFSKMGADGKPIYDERNKLQKGPNYWKPEPSISNFLLHRIAEHQIQSNPDQA